MKADIGIIGAMEEEVEAIIAALTDRESECVSGITFYLGRIGEKRIVVAKCGIGKVFAAICAQTMIIKYSPDLIVNTGVGGALRSGLNSGDIVVASNLCQHDMDTSAIGDPVGMVSGINRTYFDADDRTRKILLDSAEKLGLNASVGRIASGDRFVASREEKEYIVSTFSADACEMEGCAVAQVAFVNNTPFAVVRAISDSADGEASMDYLTFLPIAAKNSANLILALVEKW